MLSRFLLSAKECHNGVISWRWSAFLKLFDAFVAMDGVEKQVKAGSGVWEVDGRVSERLC
jgi:hypothetical protein